MNQFRCPNCGFTYDESKGCADEGFPPDTPWSKIPDDWACPDCSVREKIDFEPVEEPGEPGDASV